MQAFNEETVYGLWFMVCGSLGATVPVNLLTCQPACRQANQLLTSHLKKEGHPVLRYPPLYQKFTINYFLDPLSRPACACC